MESESLFYAPFVANAFSFFFSKSNVHFLLFVSFTVYILFNVIAYSMALNIYTSNRETLLLIWIFLLRLLCFYFSSSLYVTLIVFLFFFNLSKRPFVIWIFLFLCYDLFRLQLNMIHCNNCQFNSSFSQNHINLFKGVVINTKINHLPLSIQKNCP